MSEVNFTHPNGNKVKLNTPSTLSGNVTINLPNTSGTLGLADTGAGFVAEGGVESTYESGGTTYMLHTFLTTGVFRCNGNKTIDFLLVGGGGASPAAQLSYGSSGGGGGGGGSGLQSRQSFNQATNSIADGATDNITITAYKTYSLLSIQTSAAAWVTLYTDQASRTADSGRNETTDPLPGSGVIAEVITTAAQTQIITPATIGWNNEATPVAAVYAKVVNKSGSTASITVTITAVQLEG